MRAPPTDQTVVVENRPGADGGIAINVLICSPANSQTFVVTALSMLRELQLAAGSRLPGGRVNVPVAAPWYGPLSAGRPGGRESHMIYPHVSPSSVERSPLDVGVLRTGILALIALIVGSMFVYDLVLSSPGTPLPRLRPSAFGTAPVLAAHPVGKLPSNHSPATLKIGE